MSPSLSNMLKAVESYLHVQKIKTTPWMLSQIHEVDFRPFVEFMSTIHY
jgi:hypothetical protein